MLQKNVVKIKKKKISYSHNVKRITYNFLVPCTSNYQGIVMLFEVKIKCVFSETNMKMNIKIKIGVGSRILTL